MKTIDNISIFVVDDNRMLTEAISNLIKNQFSTHQIEVYAFETGEQCLSNLNKLHPQIIILDYHLDSTVKDAKNGMEIFKMIRKHDEGAFVIFLSAQNKLHVAANVIKEGAHDYVIKDSSAFENISQILTYLIFKLKHENSETDLLFPN